MARPSGKYALKPIREPATLDKSMLLSSLRSYTRTDRWWTDPVAWVEDCVSDCDLTVYQKRSMRALANNRRVAVRGPRGLGKSTTNALTALWFAVTRDARRVDWKVVTTAYKLAQLQEYLWPEIHKWASRLRWDVIGRPEFTRDELQDMHIKLSTGRALWMVAGKDGSSEGAHADHLLYIFDESKIIPETMFDSAEGTLNGPNAFAMMTSTPGLEQGRFYRVFQAREQFADWETVTVTKEEVIAAGQMNPKWAADRLAQWTVHSAMYQQQVLGNFYSESGQVVIPASYIDAGRERWDTWHHRGRVPGSAGVGRTVFGLDVARAGHDKTVLLRLDGTVVTDIERWQVPDLTSTAARARALVGEVPKPIVMVDADGLGAGAFDILRQFAAQGWHGLPIEFHAGTKSDRTVAGTKFVNTRSAAWWALRQALDPENPDGLAIPDDVDLIGDLTAPTWSNRPRDDALMVESKDTVNARIGRSTDTGDALLMAWWGALHHRSGSTQAASVSWGTGVPDDWHGFSGMVQSGMRGMVA